jgi:hypothetical protein
MTRNHIGAIAAPAAHVLKKQVADAAKGRPALLRGGAGQAQGQWFGPTVLAPTSTIRWR